MNNFRRSLFSLMGSLLALSSGYAQIGKVQIPPPVKLPPPVRVPPIVLVPAVKGWADLHAHPASHMAFGAANSGGTTLFSGLPGRSHTADTLARDVPDCAPSHFWDDADVVRALLRTMVRNGMDGGLPHGRNGAPTFASWPHARSVLHQQMHIKWVRRAYEGGQRLMVASVTDNETLAMIWNRHNAATRPTTSPTFDFDTARAQLRFISEWVAANSSWMEIVTTPQAARTAIGQGKMAIILGVELDKLTTDQILTLIREHRVRQVIPIHLADNQFGGTAAYSDMFNTTNHFLNGSLIRVVGDPALRFRFNRPQYLRYIEHSEPDDFVSWVAGFLTAGGLGVGAVKPTKVSDADYASTGYQRAVGGHRNARPANETELKRLLRTGVLIDLAHMSQVTQVATLRIAQDAQYPVMNSHSEIRSGTADNERTMRATEARSMGRLGGVLGIGTVGDNDVAKIANEHAAEPSTYWVRLTGRTREHLRAPRTVFVRPGGHAYRFARVRVVTADDDKRDSEGAWAVLVLRGGRRIEIALDPELKGFGGAAIKTVTADLGVDVSLDQIERVGVRHHTGSYFKDGLWRDEDNWNIGDFEFELLPDPVASWTRDAAEWLTTMGGARVAFGTDFNGLEKLVPGLNTIQVRYPIDIVRRFAPHMRLAGGAVPPVLAQQRIGTRTLHLRTDGLADYGMLPDFLQAVSMQPRGEEVVNAFFNGAEDVIQMWERAWVAKDRVR